MKDKYRGRMKILFAFGILFLVVSILLAIIFLDSKKTYTVEFDLNGGTLLNGSLVQRVMQGQDAIPPSVAMNGAYLRGWSTSYKRVTRDLVVEAVWEYETTAGIIYTENDNQNFTEIAGSYPNLRGEVYLDSYFNEKKVLGILDGAFSHQTGITKIYLLNGLISIGEKAFFGCSALTEIEIPETVATVGGSAFRNCTDLEKLTLNEGLLSIGEYAFADCIKLTEVFIPESVTNIDANAFAGCENLVIKTTIPPEEWPAGWANGWQGDATVEFVEPETDEETDFEKEDKKNGRD